MSNVGTWAHATAVVLLIRSLGGGGRELGLAAACQFGPLLLLGLKAGAIADRVDRFRQLLVLSVVLGAVVFALGTLVLAGRAEIPGVLALTAVFGTVSAFENPTRRTFITELVPPSQVGNVLSLSSSVMTSARLVGPAIAASIASVTSPGIVFIINGISYTAVVVSMLRLDRDRLHPIGRASRTKTPVRDGLAAVWSTPELRPIIIVFAIVSTFAYNHRVGFPLLVSERLHRPDSYYGWLLSAMSLGNASGALLIGRLDQIPPRLIAGSGLAVGGALGGIALAPSAAFAIAIAVVLGLAMSSFSNAAIVLIQQRIDSSMRSRVLALTTVLFIGSTPIGGVLTGLVGDRSGALWANMYGAIISATTCALALGLTLRRSRRNASD